MSASDDTTALSPAERLARDARALEQLEPAGEIYELYVRETNTGETIAERFPAATFPSGWADEGRWFVMRCGVHPTNGPDVHIVATEPKGFGELVLAARPRIGSAALIQLAGGGSVDVKLTGKVTGQPGRYTANIYRWNTTSPSGALGVGDFTSVATGVQFQNIVEADSGLGVHVFDPSTDDVWGQGRISGSKADGTLLVVGIAMALRICS